MRKKEDFILYLVAEERNSKSTICFKKGYKQESYDKWLETFKNDFNVKKILVIKDGQEEVIFER